MRVLLLLLVLLVPVSGKAETGGCPCGIFGGIQRECIRPGSLCIKGECNFVDGGTLIPVSCEQNTALANNSVELRYQYSYGVDKGECVCGQNKKCETYSGKQGFCDTSKLATISIPNSADTKTAYYCYTTVMRSGDAALQHSTTFIPQSDCKNAPYYGANSSTSSGVNTEPAPNPNATATGKTNPDNICECTSNKDCQEEDEVCVLETDKSGYCVLKKDKQTIPTRCKKKSNNQGGVISNPTSSASSGGSGSSSGSGNANNNSTSEEPGSSNAGSSTSGGAAAPKNTGENGDLAVGDSGEVLDEAVNGSEAAASQAVSGDWHTMRALGQKPVSDAEKRSYNKNVMPPPSGLIVEADPNGGTPGTGGSSGAGGGTNIPSVPGTGVTIDPNAPILFKPILRN